MAKGKATQVTQNTSGRTKAVKKNPGPAQMEKTNFTHVNGRTLNSHEKREAWKADGGRADHQSIPHWKTGKVYVPSTAANLLISTRV